MVVERKHARFYPWILAGLVFLYIVTFPFLKNPVLVAVPVAVTGWFYYQRAGFLGGLFSFFINLLLIDLYIYEINWRTVEQIENGLAIGHVFVMIIGVAFGFLRTELEHLHKNYQRTSSQERMLILINMIVRDILEGKDLQESYFRMLTHLANLFVADYAYLIYWQGAEFQSEILSSTMPDQNLGDTVLNISKTGLIMTVMESNRPLYIEDAQSSRLVLDSPIFQRHLATIRSAMAFPLITQGYRFGVIVLGFDSPRRIDPNELTHFQLTSVQITLALKTVLQERRIEKQLKEAKALNAIETALSESETIGLDAVLQIIVNAAMEIIPQVTNAVLHILDPERQLLIPRAVAGNFAGRRSNLNMHIGQGVAGQVLSLGEAVTIQDIRTDDRFINSTIPVSFRSMAVAPVIYNQKRIGTISVLGSEVGSFDRDEVNLLTSLGTLSAIAIENATLYESMQVELNTRIKLHDALVNSIESERRLRLSAETTAEASLALVSTLDEDAVLNEVLAQVEKLLPGYAYSIELVEDDQYLLVKAQRGYESHTYGDLGRQPIHALPLQWEAFQKKTVLVVPDTWEEPRWVNYPSYGWIRSHLGIPMLWRNHLLGILNIDHEKPNMLSEETASSLTILVNVATATIANAQLLVDTQQSLKEISSLYEVSRGLIALDFNELLVTTVELLHKNVGYYHVQVYLEDPATGDLHLAAASGVPEQTLQVGKSVMPSGLGIAGHVYATSMPFFTNNVNEVHFYAPNPLLADTQSVLAVPLKIGERTFGVLDIHQSPPGKLSSRDLQMLGAVAEQLTVSLQNAKLYQDLQAALKQEQTMRAQLMQSERLAMAGRLLASVSHELNNPLQAIQNVLFLLKRDSRLTRQGQEDLEVILSETERMTSLLGRLRTTYRNPLVQEYSEVRLSAVVEDVHALTATYMRHKNIAFEFVPEGTELLVNGIPDQLRQVLLNLFMNAIDAMPMGGRITVRMQSLPDAQKVYFSVQDTGAGISPDILPNIFEPFTTDKETGTGLGMTITHDIIVQHCGEIQAHNMPEGGAIFKIWLPAVDKE